MHPTAVQLGPYRELAAYRRCWSVQARSAA